MSNVTQYDQDDRGGSCAPAAAGEAPAPPATPYDRFVGLIRATATKARHEMGIDRALAVADGTILYTFAHMAFAELDELDKRAVAKRFLATFTKAIETTTPAVVREMVREHVEGLVIEALSARLAQLGTMVEAQIADRLEKEVRAVVDDKVRAALRTVKGSL